jgi:hypothetical protein
MNNNHNILRRLPFVLSVYTFKKSKLLEEFSGRKEKKNYCLYNWVFFLHNSE